MPRTNDPSQLRPGSGATSEPNSGPLAAHVSPVAASHPATGVTVTDPYARFPMAGSVQAVLAELAAMVPPTSPGIGSEGVAGLGPVNSGVPDWGVLKLAHGAVPFTGNAGADPHTVYPYYWRAPVCSDGVGLTGDGLDPAEDPVFNVSDGVYTGGGAGKAHAGAVTVSRTDPAGTVAQHSWRLMPPLASEYFVVSGVVSPADRGVLALVAWAPGDTSAPTAAATANDVLARCPAAILLGDGLRSGTRDGAPGGLFTESSGPVRAEGGIDFTANPAAPYTVTLNLTSLGIPGATSYVFTALAAGPAGAQEFVVGGGGATTAANFAAAVNAVLYPRFLLAQPSGATVELQVAVPGTTGNSVTVATTGAGVATVNPTGGTDTEASPYLFPGRAAGQFHLEEIHSGVTAGIATPFRDPKAGQVRLLTDPGAFGGLTATGGIPILGATSSSIGSDPPALFSFGLGGGTDGNFFAYRLPYLDDYGPSTRLAYTPDDEKDRFFTRLAPAASVGDPLPTAGGYGNYRANWWGHQVARYRHRQPLTATVSGSLRRFGGFALVHFKTEEAFESYVRDGVAPSAADLYSVNLANWSGSAQPANLVTASSPPALAASSLRAEAASDSNGAAAVAVAGTYTPANGGATTRVSGVPYYVPRDPSSLTGANLGLTAFSLTFTGLFDSTYYTHDRIPTGGPLVADARRFALNQNPVFLSLASFSRGGTEAGASLTISAGTLTLFPAELGQVRRARIEFGYADLTAGAALDPASGDGATLAPAPGATPDDGVNFAGDSIPVFTRNAKVRVFVRRPLYLDGPTGYPRPSVTHYDVTSTAGLRLLYHGMRETSAAPETVPYGNATDPAKVTRDATKDADERFLDEVYRYPRTWAPIADGRLAQLTGPGLPGGFSAIPVPVRPGSDPDYPGWYTGNTHILPLPMNEAQVAGWPERNPPYTDGLSEPFPALGCLVYPQEDYTGCDPVGPDYSGTAGDCDYVRAFDVGAAAVGGQRLRITIWGVDWTDLQYVGPGPGGAGIAVQVKVPGLTAWMDAGRANGAGPSKQDPATDGAGCAVIGPNTFSVTDASTQLRYTQVEVDVGPAATFFLNGEGRCPVLVKVTLKDSVAGRALDLENVAASAATAGVRGVARITIVAV